MPRYIERKNPNELAQNLGIDARHGVHLASPLRLAPLLRQHTLIHRQRRAEPQGVVDMVAALVGGVGVDEDREAGAVEHQPGDDRSEQFGREGDLEHGAGVGADRAVAPGAEPDREPLRNRFAQPPRRLRLTLAAEIDVGVEGGDLGDGAHRQAAVLSRNAVSLAIHGAKLGRARIAST
jgi:hypothetical protein